MTTYIHCISNSIICSIIVFEFLGRFYLLWAFLTSYVHCILNIPLYGLKFSHVATRFQRFWHDYNVHRIFNTLILSYMLNDCGYISGAFLLSVSDSDKVLTLHFQCHYMLTIVFEFRERSCSMLAFVTTYINCIFNTFIG